MRNPAIWRTAVHEAGHFVAVMIAGLGDGVQRLTVRPIVRADGVTVKGRLERRRAPIEFLMMAEQRGRPPGSVVVAGPAGEASLRTYEEHRSGLAMHLLIEALAGVAADTELAGGTGLMGKEDYEHAFAAAKLLVPESEVGGFMEDRLTELREVFRGPLRAPTVACAERLMTRRTIVGAELLALWEEIRPRVPGELERPAP